MGHEVWGRAARGQPCRCLSKRCWWPSEPMDCGDLSFENVGVFSSSPFFVLVFSSCLSFGRFFVVFRKCVGFSLMDCKRAGLALPSIPVLRKLTGVRGKDSQQAADPLFPRSGCRSHNIPLLSGHGSEHLYLLFESQTDLPTAASMFATYCIKCCGPE